MAAIKPTIIVGALITAALVLAALPGTAAQSPLAAPELAPAPGLDCLVYLTNVSDCLTYVQPGSILTKPDTGCCPEVAGLVESQPICLCKLLGNPDSFGIAIDLKKALKLPSVCGFSTPPLSLCADLGIPVGVPTSSEAPVSAGGVSPTGFAASPTSGNNGNGASSIAVSNLSFVIGLAIALLIAFF